MAQYILPIKKRSTFLKVREKSKFIRSNSFNLQILEDKTLNGSIAVGYITTKRLGNAVIRNKAKRIMREVTRKVISKYGKINCYYVLIAKTSLFKIPFKLLENELETKIR
tara:strand:- start:150 stop:479 length:330 start_codon:yes stop_codon:yes gene_type:complete